MRWKNGGDEEEEENTLEEEEEVEGKGIISWCLCVIGCVSR